MSFAQGYAAVRNSAAWTVSDHMTCCRIVGEDAYAVMDRICPSELYLRDGQVLHTVLLDDGATILADLYLCREEDDFLLVSESAPGCDIASLLKNRIAAGEDARVVDLAADHGIVSINGPYAWEVVGELLGPDVISLPYMSFFAGEDMVCIRAGKTGEYGYDLIVPRGDIPAWTARLGDLGNRLDVCEAALAVLDQCALENWFFNIRREGRYGLKPLELQLQWRVSSRRTYPGSEALAADRRRGPGSRIVAVTSVCELTEGAFVRHGDQEIGKLVNAGRSPLLDAWVGLALIRTELSHPGIDCFTVEAGGKAAPVRTVTPPVLNNRSIFVSPQIHSYATRGDFEFPPLAKAFA